MKNLLQRIPWKWLLLFLILVADLIIWKAVAAEDRRGELAIHFLNVGQGDAILIDAPNGNQVLLDAGPGRQILPRLAEVMPFYDRSIDLLIASHPDLDHVGGMPDVVQRYSISGFMEPGVEGSNGAYRVLKSELKKQNIREVTARRGMKVVLDSGVYLVILFPNQDVAGWKSNQASIIAKLVYGSTSVLLTGDAEARSEQVVGYLDGERLVSDVLKAGHHGSKTSSSPDFVNQVRPQYAVISAGKDNRYGHPHAQTLNTLAAAGAQIFRTDQDGTITLKSDGENIQMLR